MAKLQVGTENGIPVEIHYEDVGEGRPVVLIHGWPLSGRSWEPQVRPLVEAGFRVITYDRRGFGWSSQPWNGYEYDTLAADLRALIEHLDLRDAAIVGFSMGGGEVARYLGAHSDDRVSAAVFAAAIPPALKKTDDNPDGAAPDSLLADFQAQIRADRPAFVDGFLTNFFAVGDRTDLVSEATRRYCLDIAEFASPKGTHDCVAAWGTDFRKDLEGVSIPVLVIHGDSDGIVPFEASGKRVGEMIDGAQVVLVEDAPHGLNVTHPEEFNRALLGFLQG